MELSKDEINVLKKAYGTIIDTHHKYHPEPEKELTDFENKFNVIPADYRYLLKEFGGCHFVDPWVYTLEELTWAYPGFIAEYSDEEETNISEDNVFPIGGLGDGSTVCIIKKTGKIAILPHDSYVETIDDLEIIASNFKEFIFDLAEQGIACDEAINGRK
ncbi:SMI1/KNR4 family protein [Paenibacillus elgii]